MQQPGGGAAGDGPAGAGPPAPPLFTPAAAAPQPRRPPPAGPPPPVRPRAEQRRIMVRTHDSDGDDFMDPDVAAGRKTAKEKPPRNRGSHKMFTELAKGFDDDQKNVVVDMGMRSMLDVKCSNLVNPVCEWLGSIYEPKLREFVIPGRGRLALDEESVFETLGVPKGRIVVPYRVDSTAQERLFPELFPGLESIPLTSSLATSLGEMRTSDDVFKRKVLMFMISTIFAPTTSTRPSNGCFPILDKISDVKNTNWCKFIADFIHNAFSKNMHQKGCRLYLMLMYVDKLDFSKVKFGPPGPPSSRLFAVAAWSNEQVKAVLAADRNSDTTYGKLQLMARHSIDYSFFGGTQNFSKWMDVHSNPSCSSQTFKQTRGKVENLIGQFASGMCELLGNLVHGWTSMSNGDGDEAARQFTAAVGGRPNRRTGCRTRHDYNSSQELPDTQEDLFGFDINIPFGDDPQGSDHNRNETNRDVTGPSEKRSRDPEDIPQPAVSKKQRPDPVTARMSEATVGGVKQTVVAPSRSSERLKKASRAADGVAMATRSSPRQATSNTGDPVDRQVNAKATKRPKKSATDGVGQKKNIPLRKLHTKLAATTRSNKQSSAATVPGGSNVDASSSVAVDGPTTDAAKHVTAGLGGGSGSDDSVSGFTKEAVPVLLSMKDAFVAQSTTVPVPTVGVHGEPAAARKRKTSEATLPPVVPDTINVTMKLPTAGGPTVDVTKKLPPKGAPNVVITKNLPPKGAPARNHSDDDFVPASTLFEEGVTVASIAHTKDAQGFFVQKRKQTVHAAPRADPAGKSSAVIGQGAVKVFTSRRSPWKHVAITSTGTEPSRKAGVESSVLPPDAQTTGLHHVQGENVSGEAVKVSTKPAVAPADQPATATDLRKTKIPIKVGVPYEPYVALQNRLAAEKKVADIPVSSPPPTAQTSGLGVDNDMFVQLSPLDSAKDITRNKRDDQERHPLAFTPPSFDLGFDKDSNEEEPIDTMPISYAQHQSEEVLMAQPMVEGRKAVTFAEPLVQASPFEVSSSMEEELRKMDEDALKSKSLSKQAASSSTTTQISHLGDVVSSATPGSVKQARVVQAPSDKDYELAIKVTKDQQAFYDIVRRFGDVRSQAKHMKAIREMRIIECSSTYVLVGELADAMRPTGRLNTNLIACGIDYINECVDIDVDKIIMPYAVTTKIWDGDFHGKVLRKYFSQAGDLKLTLKKYIMFAMYQELAPQDPKDKSGHFYTICLNLKNQRFEVLDSARDGDDESLRSHYEYFIANVKETWKRHYEKSKVQISQYPTQYIKTTQQENTRDCGFFMFEYLAWWVGRKVPYVSSEYVTALRKVLTWNWVTNTEFNKRVEAKDFIEDSVKAAAKKYK